MDISITISTLYIALLGLLFIPFTLYVGLYRGKSRIFLGDGNDEEMLKRIRAQGNFIETVPLALILLAALEISGASPIFLHCLGISLFVGRISHYLQMVGVVKHLIFRGGGMMLTMLVYLTGSCWLLTKLYLFS